MPGQVFGNNFGQLWCAVKLGAMLVSTGKVCVVRFVEGASACKTGTPPNESLVEPPPRQWPSIIGTSLFHIGLCNKIPPSGLSEVPQQTGHQYQSHSVTTMFGNDVKQSYFDREASSSIPVLIATILISNLICIFHIRAPRMSAPRISEYVVAQVFTTQED